MTQQINLYDPSLQRQREWLTLRNVVGMGVACAILVAAPGLATRLELPALTRLSSANEAQIKAAREQVTLLGQAIASRKPDPRVEQELLGRRLMLETRGAVRDMLRKSLGVEAGGRFADHLRGLARQSLSGLWLTGFSVDAGGGMEIRGRTTDPALLPEYIRRLNKEAAFQGRAFAALKLDPGKPDAPAGPAAAPVPPSGASAAAPRAPYHEFVLVPVKTGETPARRAAATGRTG